MWGVSKNNDSLLVFRFQGILTHPESLNHWIYYSDIPNQIYTLLQVVFSEVCPIGKSNNAILKCADWKFEWNWTMSKERLLFYPRILSQISTRYVTKCFGWFARNWNQIEYVSVKNVFKICYNRNLIFKSEFCCLKFPMASTQTENIFQNKEAVKTPPEKNVG